MFAITEEAGSISATTRGRGPTMKSQANDSSQNLRGQERCSLFGSSHPSLNVPSSTSVPFKFEVCIPARAAEYGRMNTHGLLEWVSFEHGSAEQVFANLLLEFLLGFLGVQETFIIRGISE